MIGFVETFFQHVHTQETSLVLTSLPQNSTPGRSGPAGSESEVQNLEIRHPEAKIKKNQPKLVFRHPITGL